MPKAKPCDRVCERCRLACTAKPDERFCSDCKKELREEMQAAGYLTRVPWHSRSRSSEAKELTRETKFGTGHG